jgi:hypothetical protein
MSFADYLGLRRDDVERMLAERDAQLARAEEEARVALARAQQEANELARQGMAPSLAATASYSDYLKLRDEAQSLLRRPRTGNYQEDSVLAALRPEEQRQGYDFATAERRAQDMANKYASDWQALKEYQRQAWDEALRRREAIKRAREEAIRAKVREIEEDTRRRRMEERARRLAPHGLQPVDDTDWERYYREQAERYNSANSGHGSGYGR